MGNRHAVVDILPKLGQARTDLTAGVPLAEVCHKLGVTVKTFKGWCYRYEGGQTRRMQELQRQNVRLRLYAMKVRQLLASLEALSADQPRAYADPNAPRAAMAVHERYG